MVSRIGHLRARLDRTEAELGARFGTGPAVEAKTLPYSGCARVYAEMGVFTAERWQWVEALEPAYEGYAAFFGGMRALALEEGYINQNGDYIGEPSNERIRKLIEDTGDRDGSA